MGVEPTGDIVDSRPPVLKTGTITGPHALPDYLPQCFTAETAYEALICSFKSNIQLAISSSSDIHETSCLLPSLFRVVITFSIAHGAMYFGNEASTRLWHAWAIARI